MCSDIWVGLRILETMTAAVMSSNRQWYGTPILPTHKNETKFEKWFKNVIDHESEHISLISQL